MQKSTPTPLISALILLLAALSPAGAEDAVGGADAVPEVLSEERLTPMPGQPDTSALSEEAVLQALESRYGAFDPSMGQGLVGLALSLRNEQRHAEAAVLLRRALHINRINDGLHDPGQMDMLNLLIDTQESARDWAGLNRSYSYLYWLLRRNPDLPARDMLNDLYRVGRWHLRAFTLETGESPGAHLAGADAAFDMAAKAVAREHGDSSPELVEPLLGLALVNLRMASYAQQADRSEEVRFMKGPGRGFLPEELEREELMLRSYRDGRDALQQVVDIHRASPDLGDKETAISLVYLADWYLMFNRRQTAAQHYTEAWQLFQAAGTDEALVQSILQRPQVLPALRFSDPGEAVQSVRAEVPDTVTAAFDVTPSGKVRNIRILEVQGEDTAGLERSAKRQLARARFRPRVENGELVATNDVKLRYVFEDE